MRTKLVYLFVVMQIAFVCFAITGFAQSEKSYNNAKVPKETLGRKLIYKLSDVGHATLEFINENYCIGWDSRTCQILFIDLKENTTEKYQCDEELLYPPVKVSPDKKTLAMIDEIKYEINGFFRIKYVLYIVDVATSAVTKYEYPEFFDVKAKQPHYKYDNIYAKKGEKIENSPLAIFWPNSKEIYVYGLSMWGIDISTGKATHLMDDNYLEKCQEQTDWRFKYGVRINSVIQGNVVYFYYDGMRKNRDDLWEQLVFTTDGRSFPLPDAGDIQGIYKNRYIVYRKNYDGSFKYSIYDFDEKKFMETGECTIFFSEKFIVSLDFKNKEIYTHDGKKTRESNIPDLYLPGEWGCEVHTNSIFIYLTDRQTGARIYYRFDLNSQQFSEVSQENIQSYCGVMSYTGGPSAWIDCEDGNTRRIFDDYNNEFYDLSW